MHNCSCLMGNSGSSESLWSNVAFIGVCIDRKTREIGNFVDAEGRRSVHVSQALEARRAALSHKAMKKPRTSRLATARSPPLSARSRQSHVDREDHILLSARSIAIQKKAPLFRDNGEEEFSQADWAPPLSARKIDMVTINEIVDKDRLAVSGATSARSTPRKAFY